MSRRRAGGDPNAAYGVTSALAYFDAHEIAWWLSDEERTERKRLGVTHKLPTGHLNSSQAAGEREPGRARLVHRGRPCAQRGEQLERDPRRPLQPPRPPRPHFATGRVEHGRVRLRRVGVEAHLRQDLLVAEAVEAGEAALRGCRSAARSQIA
jgi:hypothetical protein